MDIEKSDSIIGHEMKEDVGNFMQTIDVEPEREEEPEKDYGEPNIDEDFNRSRIAIIKILEENEKVIKDAKTIAESTEHPRAYEVLGNLMSQQASFAKELLELYKKQKQIKSMKEVKEETPSLNQHNIENQQNNILFCGSTSELLKAISKS